MAIVTHANPDVLDPGLAGDYPFFPRDPTGAPLWTDDPSRPQSAIYLINGQQVRVAGVPRGVRRHRDPRSGEVVTIDVTPHDAPGHPVDPPVIVGWTPGYGARRVGE